MCLPDQHDLSEALDADLGNTHDHEEHLAADGQLCT